MGDGRKESSEFHEGQTIGRYTLVRLLGTGAFGAVYEALREPLQKRVALKLFNADLLAQPDARERAVREARAAARVRHPHIVDVHDVGVIERTIYLEMELLDGESLAAHLARKGSLAVSEAVDLMLPIVSAVETAHAAGVIHRDLKPGNVLLARPRAGVVHPTLLDFGIAKMRDPDLGASLTESGAFLGTPYYMSPEQIANARRVDARSDQWALAVILYELCAGRRPFQGNGILELIGRIQKGEFPAMRSVKTDIPDALDAVITRALSLDPAERFPSVRAFGRALLPFASDAARASWRDDFSDDPPPRASNAPREEPSPPSVALLPEAESAKAAPPSSPSGSSRAHERDAAHEPPTRRVPVARLLVAGGALVALSLGARALVSSRPPDDAPPPTTVLARTPWSPPDVRPSPDSSANLDRPSASGEPREADVPHPPDGRRVRSEAAETRGGRHTAPDATSPELSHPAADVAPARVDIEYTAPNL